MSDFTNEINETMSPKDFAAAEAAAKNYKTLNRAVKTELTAIKCDVEWVKSDKVEGTMFECAVTPSTFNPSLPELWIEPTGMGGLIDRVKAGLYVAQPTDIGNYLFYTENGVINPYFQVYANTNPDYPMGTLGVVGTKFWDQNSIARVERGTGIVHLERHVVFSHADNNFDA